MTSTMLVANVGSIIAEFAGCSAALSLFGVPSWMSALLAATVVVLLLTRGNYSKVQYLFVAVGISCRSPTSCRRCWPIPTGAARPRRSSSARLAPRRLLAHRRRHGRNDDHAVGPGLHPVVRRGQASRSRRPDGIAPGCGSRRLPDQPDRRLHRRRLRRRRVVHGYAGGHGLRGRGQQIAQSFEAAGRRRRLRSCSRSACWRHPSLVSASSRSRAPTQRAKRSAGRPASTGACARRRPSTA
jgi:hypothetical protein